MGVKLPAAGVHPGQRWRGESVAEFGWLPGDQGAVADAWQAERYGAARSASGPATPTSRSGHADHPPAVPAFRKLDAIAVLTARLLPHPWSHCRSRTDQECSKRIMVFIVALLMARYSTLFDRPHRVPPPGPTGESLVTQLVEGLSAAAERETNPERKTQV